MSNLIFSELDISKDVKRAVAEMGFEEATPIQSQTIPYIMKGLDIIGQAQTGTGKTCAFGIPAIEMVDPDEESVQALILCPTRELAIQSSEELKNVAKFKKGIRILPIYGGQPIDRQILALKKKPQIVIGTPGRVMDHMRRHTLKLGKLKMMILDEADEMLNMGFKEDIDTILQSVPEERQTILFSATMPKEILELASTYQKDAVNIKAAHKELTVPSIEQVYYEVRESLKLDLLARLIDAHNIKLSLVFCNTKKRVDELCTSLQAMGYSAEALHGDMKQAQRDRVMNGFRKNAFDILIATDVAARGIDVDDIEAVFNYDLPSDEEYYVHRIGRTGRAGRAGKAYTFVSGRELYKLKEIQRYTKAPIIAAKPPTMLDVEEKKVTKALEDMKAAIEEGHLTRFVGYVERFLEENPIAIAEDTYVTSLDVAAAFLKMASGIVAPPNSKDELASVSAANVGRTGGRAVSRLFVNLGNKDNVKARHIVEGISSATNVPFKVIGKVDIYDNFSFVEVPTEYVAEILDSVRKIRVKNKKVNIEKSNRK